MNATNLSIEPRSFFQSQEELHAYISAWRATTANRRKLPPSYFAAHALLTGCPLNKAFTACDGKFYGLANALVHLDSICVARWRFEWRKEGVSFDHALILETTFNKVAEWLRAQELYSARVRDALVDGSHPLLTFKALSVPREARHGQA